MGHIGSCSPTGQGQDACVRLRSSIPPPNGAKAIPLSSCKANQPGRVLSLSASPYKWNFVLLSEAHPVSPPEPWWEIRPHFPAFLAAGSSALETTHSTSHGSWWYLDRNNPEPSPLWWLVATVGGVGGGGRGFEDSEHPGAAAGCSVVVREAQWHLLQRAVVSSIHQLSDITGGIAAAWVASNLVHLYNGWHNCAMMKEIPHGVSNEKRFSWAHTLWQGRTGTLVDRLLTI